MKRIKFLLAALLLTGFMSTAYAVTDKEMEEARTYTAKLYLRWANNGSGYLDDLNPKTMSELTKKLSAKEKENLKAFTAADKAVDYSKWGKEELVKYWSDTFFQNSGLSADGKRARSQVKKKLNGMTISAAPEKPAEEKAEKPVKEEPAKPQLTGVDSAAIQPANVTSEEETEVKLDSIVADLDTPATATPKSASNYTTLYIVILGVLVVVVIFLVVYASKVMGANNRAKTKVRQNDERADDAEPKHTPLQATDNKYNVLQGRYDAAIAENSRLSNELTTARGRIHQLSEEIEQLQERIKRYEEARQTQHSAADPTRHEEVAASTIYLGRVNPQGLFVRADRRLNPEQSVFSLRTTDGYTGTFRVVDDPAISRRLLSDPERYLTGGCTGELLDDTEGCRRVITESAGTAIFEDGCWRLLRKARIAYE